VSQLDDHDVLPRAIIGKAGRHAADPPRGADQGSEAVLKYIQGTQMKRQDCHIALVRELNAEGADIHSVEDLKERRYPQGCVEILAAWLPRIDDANLRELVVWALQSSYRRS
jgi:hypothetical protein